MPDFSQRLFNIAMAAAGFGKPQRLSVLIFHRVLPERDPMRPAEPDAAEFDWQMRLLKRYFTVLPLSVAQRLLAQDKLPPNAACVTFDDGYADNLTVALPVLQRHAIPATVFVAAGYLDGGRMWNDTVVEALRNYAGPQLDLTGAGLASYAITDIASRRRAAHDIISSSKYLGQTQRQDIADSVAAQSSGLPDNLMLTRAQLISLHQQGVEIGGHTLSHPILTRTTTARAREEIGQGKAALETIIGEPLRLFAYPNGQPGKDYTDTHVELVRAAGFSAAVSTRWGVADRHTDPFQLPRFTPWDKSAARYLLRMALNKRQLQTSAGRSPCGPPPSN